MELYTSVNGKPDSSESIKWTNLGLISTTLYHGSCISRTSLWIDKHEMPAHRMSCLWKFKKDEVDEWVNAGGVAEHTKGIRTRNE